MCTKYQSYKIFTSSYLTDPTHCTWWYDAEAFLFSLVNEPGWAPVKLSQTGSPQHYNPWLAIYSCSYYGPTFGAGHDIYIASNAAYSSNSYSYLSMFFPQSGHGYDRSTFLAGSQYFTPDEIETFFFEPFIPEGEI